MKEKVIVMIIHVDDCYVIVDIESIEHVVKEIEKEGLKIKVNYDTSDFLSCELMFDKEKKKAWIGQPHLLKKMEQNFKHLIKDKQQYKTPGTPHQGIVRPVEGESKISEEDPKMYRSGVGALLQFVKFSRPDIANAVHELSKCMDGATPAAFKEMVRLIKFVLDTKDLGLKVQPEIDNKNESHTTVYTDSDWAGDKESRHSVSGYVMFLMEVPILWKSRSQKTISLSSSEAEYYALSEAAKEIKFIVQILNSIGIKIKMPIVV